MLFVMFPSLVIPILALHFSDDLVLPFDIEVYANTIGDYLQQAIKEAQDLKLSLNFKPLETAVH